MPVGIPSDWSISHQAFFFHPVYTTAPQLTECLEEATRADSSVSFMHHDPSVFLMIFL